MKKVIINADDFGITNAVSDAIIDLHRKGIVTSATLMVNMPGTDHAITLAKENPTLGVGLHFNITESRSMVGASSLTDINGSFIGKMPLNKKITLAGLNKGDVLKELEAQYNVLQESGIRITHIDSHQHIHMNPRVFPIVADFAREKGVAIRIAFPQVIRRKAGRINLKKRIKQVVLAFAARKNRKYADKIGLSYNQSFNSIFDVHPFQMPENGDYTWLIDQSRSEYHELMVHPYILSGELKTIYGEKYTSKKAFFGKAEKEYEALKKEQLPTELTLSTFADLA